MSCRSSSFVRFPASSFVLPPPDLYRIDSSTGYWSTKLHLIIRKRSRRSVTHWFSFFLLFIILFVAWNDSRFSVLQFQVRHLMTRTACVPFTLVRSSPLLSAVECKFHLYALHSFIVDWCFCSKVDNMTVLFAFSVITASRSIYIIYIPDTLFHTVRTYIRLIYVIAASVRVSSSSLERITRRRVSLWRIHMFLFLLSFRFYSTALSCYMKILRTVEPQ